MVKDAVATGLLEGMVAETERLGLGSRLIEDYAGHRTRDYSRAWDDCSTRWPLRAFGTETAFLAAVDRLVPAQPNQSGRPGPFPVPQNGDRGYTQLVEILLRVSGPQLRPTDVSVEVEPHQTIGKLAEALADSFALAGDARGSVVLERTGRVLQSDDLISSSGVVSGDSLRIGQIGMLPEAPSPPLQAISFDIIFGPDSARNHPLTPGSYVFGRSEDCDVVSTDLTVSSRHLHVMIDESLNATIAPVESTLNGVTVNGRPIDSSVTVRPDDVVAMGATRVCFRTFTRAPVDSVDQLGQIEFHRTPYRRELIRPREFTAFGPIPVKPEPRKFQVLTILAPLAAGLAMFAFSGQASFLALTLLSPIAMVGSWWEDRKAGRTKHAQQVERFEAKLAQRRGEAETAFEAERVERLNASPDLADLARRAQLRTIDLWPRGRTSPDFLDVRIGMGSLSTLIKLPVETNGDEEFRDAAGDALSGFDQLTDVPITVNLAEVGVLGIHGLPQVADSVMSSLAIQAASLHSPEDLVIAAAIGSSRESARWLKWVPHSRSVTSPLARHHLTSDTDEANELLRDFISIAHDRAGVTGDQTDRRWPWVLLLLDGDLNLDPTLVSQLLDLCPNSGMSVVWMSTDAAHVPRQASIIVDSGDGSSYATVWSTDPEVPIRTAELSPIAADIAEAVAMSLAPVRDASVATQTTSIPRTAPLLTVLGVDVATPDWVMQRWSNNVDYHLRHPVGLGASGVFSLDLVADGPHALIGGTSGAGKSELLQSIVASLISCHPPTRLNFLFVDYKGGASSTVFTDVPHTVGYVTNLNAELALRALTSLRAELNERMRRLEGKAKDLADMLRDFPDEAPPSLVIVVDEFATLVKEVPEFVAGVVDIAQRGRSLGIHLILATQRPSGSVNDNILANTNLRMSLRMLDSGESTAIIASPAAAEIPAPLKGRGYARLGPRDLIPFQSAFAGAPLRSNLGEAPVLVRTFSLDGAGEILNVSTSRTPGTPAQHEQTHLDSVVSAVKAAAQRLQLPKSRPPWRDALADHINLGEVMALNRAAIPAENIGKEVVVGMIDDPESQDQFPATVDLEESGGMLVFGAGGSGKTTLLRSVAAGIAMSASQDQVVVFGLDFASRALRSLEVLPVVNEVATGDDLEAVTRILSLLDNELEVRRALMAEQQAETLTAYLGQGHRLARIVVLIDGLPNLVASFLSSGSSFGSSLEVWMERLSRVVLDGRQVGIHVVATADRRSGLPTVLQSALGHRVILRQSDENAYADHGIGMARARTLELSPGRGLWKADKVVQLACVSSTGDAKAQSDALVELAQTLSITKSTTLHSSPLAEIVRHDGLATLADETSVAIGVCDLTGAPAILDPFHGNTLIAGPPGSGRSTALRTIAMAARSVSELWAVGPSGSPLQACATNHQAFGRAEQIQSLLAMLITACEFPSDRPRLLVIDDLDSFDDPSLFSLWNDLTKSDGLDIVASIESRYLSSFCTVALVEELKRSRKVLLLQPDDPMAAYQQLGVRVPLRPGMRLPPGRAVMVVNRTPKIIQIAS